MLLCAELAADAPPDTAPVALILCTPSDAVSVLTAFSPVPVRLPYWSPAKPPVVYATLPASVCVCAGRPDCAAVSFTVSAPTVSPSVLFVSPVPCPAPTGARPLRSGILNVVDPFPEPHVVPITLYKPEYVVLDSVDPSQIFHPVGTFALAREQ